MAGEGKRRLERAVDGMISKKQDKLNLIPALLGVYRAGQKTIVVAERPDFVYCRVRGSTSDVVLAFNETVSETWDLPILIYRDPNVPDIYKVYGRDIRTYSDWGGDFYSSKPHGRSHSFGRPEGNDPVWIYKRQQMALLPRPLVSGTLGIFIEPEFYYFDGTYRWWPGSGTTSLEGFKPTGSVNGRFVTVYIDGLTGNPAYLSGPEFNAYIPPLDPIEYVTLPRPDQGLPIAAVFLLTGTERIGWGEIFDLRLTVAPVPGTGSNMIIYDEGVLQGTVGTMNFVGDSVEAIVSGSFAWISVTGSASSVPVTGSVTVYEEGVLLGQADAINVVGDNAEVVLSGSVAHIMHSGAAGGGGGDPPTTGSIVILDDGTTLGSALGIDFGDKTVGVSISGSFARTAIPGRTWGGVAVRYNFVTGTSVASGDMNFDSLTGSLVTEIKGAWVDKDGGFTSPRLLDIAGAFDTRIVVWSEHDPKKWWMGSMGSSFSQVPPASTTLGVEYIHHQGGDTPFDQDESVLLSTSYQRNQTGTVVIYDEGTFLDNFKEMRFIGGGVEVFDSGSYAAVSIQAAGGDPPVTGSFVIFDEGSILGSVLGINYTGDNVETVVSGSFAHVMITGTAGGGGGGAELTVVTGTFETRTILYENTTTGSATPEWEIANIDQSYTHLEINIWGRTDRADTEDVVVCYLNDDQTDSNYRMGDAVGGSSAWAVFASDRAWVGLLTAATADANRFGTVHVRIPFYTQSDNGHLLKGQGGVRRDGDVANVHEFIMHWETLAAITQLNVQPAFGSNFTAGSRIEVIGIRETVLVTSVEGTTEPSIADLTVTTGSFDVGTVLLDETLGGDQSGFYASGSFSDYEYIEIHLTGRKSTNGTGLVEIAFNEDTTDANYRRTHHQAEAASHIVAEADDRRIGFLPGLDGPTNVSDATKITIFDPGDTTFFKVVQSENTHTNPITDIFIGHFGAVWEDTSAITQIRVDLASGDFVAGSRCKIVGFSRRVLVTEVSGGILVDGVTDFLALDDTPASYSGQSGSYVRVDEDENALEFVPPTFLNLNDTPASYTPSGAFVQLNPALDGLQFAEVEPWIEVDGGVGFQNSWVNFNDEGGTYVTAAYYKDPFGRVHLKGMVKNGTMGAVIFTLPEGYRPFQQVVFLVADSAISGHIDIKANGDVDPGNNLSTTWGVLNGISFRAED